MDNIQTTDVRLAQKEGAVKAYCTVFVNGVEIRGVKIVDGKNGIFAGLPQKVAMKEGKVMKDDAGNPIRFPIVLFESRVLREQVTEAVKGALTSATSATEG